MPRERRKTDWGTRDFTLVQDKVKITWMQWWWNCQYRVLELNIAGCNKLFICFVFQKKSQAFQKKSPNQDPSPTTWHGALKTIFFVFQKKNQVFQKKSPNHDPSPTTSHHPPHNKCVGSLSEYEINKKIKKPCRQDLCEVFLVYEHTALEIEMVSKLFYPNPQLHQILKPIRLFFCTNLYIYI